MHLTEEFHCNKNCVFLYQPAHCGVTPPLPQYAFMEWCSVKAQGQLYLYLYALTSIFSFGFRICLDLFVVQC